MRSGLPEHVCTSAQDSWQFLTFEGQICLLHGSVSNLILLANPWLEMQGVTGFVRIAQTSEKQVAEARSNRRKPMSLKPQERGPIPAETARVAHAAYLVI